MFVNTEQNVDNYILDKLKKIRLKFEDAVEVEIPDIINFDMDLNKTNASYIGFESVFNNVELHRHFSSESKIINIHFESNCVNVEDGGAKLSGFIEYDIPCSMSIVKLKTGANYNSLGTMIIKLEGSVR